MTLPTTSTGACPTSPAAGLEAAFAACVAQVKALDPDRYLACLFAPRASQPYLFALYAFNAEIARIRELVSEPMPGEIRHQWWREALSCGRAEAAAENPIAAALCHTLTRFDLPPDPLLALIEARSFDLYDDPMPTWLDLEGYCGETSSALIRLATLILSGGKDAGSADLCGYAGVAYAMTGLLRAFPIHARRNQCYIPHEVLISCGLAPEDLFAGQDSGKLRAALGTVRARAQTHLDTFRQGVDALDPAIRPAFYPVSLVQPYLDQMASADYRPYETLVTLSPLAKLWRLGLCAWRARR
ncbi:MAG: phytoene [Beijerinckiaceae bacterium]|nr:MAG: phytoene [Beijerinckiaceae bacterium]